MAAFFYVDVLTTKTFKFEIVSHVKYKLLLPSSVGHFICYKYISMWKFDRRKLNVAVTPVICLVYKN